jgi:hypothetical protein
MPKEPQHVTDARTLLPTALADKYQMTYSAWKHAKARAKPKGHWSPEFDRFADFLCHVGPRRHRHQSLDRLDNDNPVYAPGLVRWRSKREQANNRSTTIRLTHDGKTLPLSEWARRTDQPPDTMRRRRRLGWSDAEIITGVRGTDGPTEQPPAPRPASIEYPTELPLDRWPWPPGTSAKIEHGFQQHCEAGWRRVDHLLWLLWQRIAGLRRERQDLVERLQAAEDYLYLDDETGEIRWCFPCQHKRQRADARYAELEHDLCQINQAIDARATFRDHVLGLSEAGRLSKWWLAVAAQAPRYRPSRDPKDGDGDF